MVNWSETVFNKIKSELASLVKKLDIIDAYYLPISAKYGDNVVDRSANMKWYNGKTFLTLIETIEIGKFKDSENPRFPVQTISVPVILSITTTVVMQEGWPEEFSGPVMM